MSNADMPSHTLRRRLNLFAAIAGMVLCASSYGADWTLPDLMHSLAQKKSGKASFVEKKYMAILDKPLESSGELSFEAPDRLEKRTLKPHPEVMLLDGDKLTVTLHDKRPLYLRLQDHPEVAALVDSIRGTLSGDQVALEKNYTIEFTGTQNKWQMTLTPVQKAVTKVVSQIRIGGADANLKTITFDQTDGDRSEMMISKVVAP
jgi:outer membrane lipoprotein-sorting protein